MTPRHVEVDPIWQAYALAVEMADRISARRAVANNFFLSVQSALVAVTVLVLPAENDPGPGAAAIIAVIGLGISAVWWMQLKSYRDLNAAKYAVILDLERQLPSKIFTDEWEKLKPVETSPWHDQYAELGVSERIIPVLFGLLYVAVPLVVGS